MSGPEVGPQLYIQANLASIAGSQGQAVQNVKVVRMLEFIQKVYQACVVSLDGGDNFDLHQASGIGSALVEGNRIRPQTSRVRQLSKIFADSGIPRARRTEMGGKEFVPLFFVGWEFRTEFIEARVVRPI